MSSDNQLSFAEFLNPDGAEFPYCCRSGFWMLFNTRLSDPAKAIRSYCSEEPRSLVKKELSKLKKHSNKIES